MSVNGVEITPWNFHELDLEVQADIINFDLIQAFDDAEFRTKLAQIGMLASGTNTE